MTTTTCVIVVQYTYVFAEDHGFLHRKRDVLVHAVHYCDLSGYDLLGRLLESHPAGDYTNVVIDCPPQAASHITSQVSVYDY